MLLENRFHMEHIFVNRNENEYSKCFCMLEARNRTMKQIIQWCCCFTGEKRKNGKFLVFIIPVKLGFVLIILPNKPRSLVVTYNWTDYVQSTESMK